MRKKLTKLIAVVGARPQFIKAAPVSRALKKSGIKEILVHTGQHYDYNMSKIFFDELRIKMPKYNLGIGSGAHGCQTGKMLEALEKVFLNERPDMVMVYGDTNSTLAGALAAVKLHIPVAHVEAGLRSFNRRMPEEINRVLTDHASDVLFCPTETAVWNLKNEGFTNIVNRGKLLGDHMVLPRPLPLPSVLNVGDVMYDSVLFNLEIAKKKSEILKKLELNNKEYYLATLHRAENTADPAVLRHLFKTLCKLGKNRPLIIPLHPRTKKLLSGTRYGNSVTITDPLSYLDMLKLTSSAKVILTDSGGLQKEAFFLNVPCVTLRGETEWSETLKNGMNLLAGTSEVEILNGVEKQEHRKFVANNIYLFGRGDASKKIVNIIKGVPG